MEVADTQSCTTSTITLLTKATQHSRSMQLQFELWRRFGVGVGVGNLVWVGEYSGVVQL